MITPMAASPANNLHASSPHISHSNQPAVIGLPVGCRVIVYRIIQVVVFRQFTTTAIL